MRKSTFAPTGRISRPGGEPSLRVFGVQTLTSALVRRAAIFGPKALSIARSASATASDLVAAFSLRVLTIDRDRPLAPAANTVHDRGFTSNPPHVRAATSFFFNAGNMLSEAPHRAGAILFELVRRYLLDQITKR